MLLNGGAEGDTDTIALPRSEFGAIGSVEVRQAADILYAQNLEDVLYTRRDFHIRHVSVSVCTVFAQAVLEACAALVELVFRGIGIREVVQPVCDIGVVAVSEVSCEHVE